jgi:lipoprotein-releasing system ATP-binding protein
VARIDYLPQPGTQVRGSSGNEPLLRGEDVHRVLGSGENAAHILKGVDLSIDCNEYLSIVGASGSGKSTLLYLMGGLDRPTAPGRVFIDGEDTRTLSDVQLASVRNEKIGFVFQFHYLLKEFTAQENIALPMLKLGRLSRSDAMERAAMLLTQFGLAEKAKRRANRLSGGEQQRVAICRALANEPAVLLADEPTGNLDKKNAERVAEIFDELASNGQSIVIVTHDPALAQRARRRITMEDGQITSDIGPDTSL